jgi:NTE family protein
MISPTPARTPTTAPASRPSIALALGGGGARGLAHILVLEVLDELGLRPKMIAGTSIGALVGAAYALGLSGFRLRAIMEETLGNRFDLIRQLFAARSEPAQRLLRLLPLRTSLLSPELLLERLLPELNDRTFADLTIPLKVVATDLAGHAPVVIEQGSLRRAVAASIAIPLVFTPVRDGEQVLVDGGLVNPLPFDLLDGAADITIAIDVSGASTPVEMGRSPAALDVLIRSIQIMEKSITNQKLAARQPDIYLDIELDDFSALEFWRARDIIEAASPIKDKLRRHLTRVLAAPTLEPSNTL